jgi:Zn-dependent M28 family amino/carboxypeptidase
LVPALVSFLVVLLTPLVGCGAKTVAEFSGEPAWRYLVKQCDYGPRAPGTAAHDSTRSFIIEHLRRRGASVSLQRFDVDDPYGDGVLALANVVGSFYPDERRRFLVAAHYDTRPRADQEDDERLRNQPIVGANDGASGVAVLLEIADILSEHRPDRLGVDLVFFDGEDYGKSQDYRYYLLGSRHFAANLKGYRPLGAVVLDMVGARDARIGQEGNSLELAPDLTRRIFERAAELGLDVFESRKAGAVYDDHVPLLQAGIPAVDLIGQPYPHWHRLSDTPDKCSVDTLRAVGRLMVDFLFDFPD